MVEYLYSENYLSNEISDVFDEIILEASDADTHICMEKLYPLIESVLTTKVGDSKFKQLVGKFMDRNNEKLHTPGPQYLIPFADNDKAEYFNLFNIEPKFIMDMVTEITESLGSKSDFKLLRGNPIFWVFYCCIRYYYLKKDKQGLNCALAIYALAAYPSVFSLFFKYEPNPGVMQYTMDNLSEKYLIKQEGSIFNGLFKSINNSFKFLSQFMKDGSDKEVIRWIQRIRNDQKSLLKNICDQYMKNHAKGNRVKLSKDSFDEIQLDVDVDNNTTMVEVITTNIVNEIMTNGLDLKRVSQCKDIAGISLADTRFYLSKIINDKYVEDIEKFIHAILFLYLYTDHRGKEDINSTYFIKWSTELFRKTNSNDENIKTIKDTLDKWAEETGIHEKFKRLGSRINYKKAIFWYFIFSIQYYNK